MSISHLVHLAFFRYQTLYVIFRHMDTRYLIHEICEMRDEIEKWCIGDTLFVNESLARVMP